MFCLQLSFAETLSSALDEKGEKMIYRPPNSIHETGNHAWHTAYLKSSVDVDVLVEIPSVSDFKPYLQLFIYN